MLKKALRGVLVLLTLGAVSAGAFVWFHVRAYDASMAKVYNVPLPQIARSTDPAVLERGRHLAESLGNCTGCHGANLGGGKVEQFGPLGRAVMANVTAGKNGKLAEYSDGELARLVLHGVRKDGTSVCFMPSQETSWWPDADVAALVSHLRTVPPVDGVPGSIELAAPAKVLDRLDIIPLDVARRVDHARSAAPPPPSPTAEYGGFLARACQGCHGNGLSGGRIPGAPAGFPVPLNLTPHETGLKTWTLTDFTTLMREGVRKNGARLDPFMPVEATRNFNDVELRALFSYLQGLPPAPFGGR